MADVHSKKQRSYNMSRIRSKNTKPEIKFRKLLYEAGLRGYRLNSKLKGRPDIILTRCRLAIFIDGCFWHKCPRHCRFPSSNVNYWTKKINGNVRRDRNVEKELKKRKWIVIRFWEHDLKGGRSLSLKLTRLKKAIQIK